jgi:hypothetical protein
MAKCLEYDKQILTSSNKIKATQIINTESGRNIKKRGTQLLNARGKNTENQQTIVEVFSKCFTTTAENIKNLVLIIV